MLIVLFGQQPESLQPKVFFACLAMIAEIMIALVTRKAMIRN